MSFCTSSSLMMMASSKLKPSQAMKATSTLRPRASSPWYVAAPSAMTWPFSTLSPTLTIGFWFWQVRWLRPTNLRRA